MHWLLCGFGWCVVFGWLDRCVGNGMSVCVGVWLAFEFFFSFLFVRSGYPGGWIGG